VSNKFIQY